MYTKYKWKSWSTISSYEETVCKITVFQDLSAQSVHDWPFLLLNPLGTLKVDYPKNEISYWKVLFYVLDLIFLADSPVSGSHFDITSHTTNYY